MTHDSPVKAQYFNDFNVLSLPRFQSQMVLKPQSIPENEKAPLLHYRKSIEIKPMKLKMGEEEKEQYLYDRSQFLHLLSHMLEIDPQNRHSADMLLQHPFITVCLLLLFDVQKSRYGYNPFKVIQSSPRYFFKFKFKFQ